MPCIFSVNCHVNNRTDAAAIDEGNFQPIHQFIIPCGDRNTVYLGNYAVAADLLYICHSIAVNFFAISSL